MTLTRIALANVEFPASPDHSVAIAERAIAEAGAAGALVVCFPEAFVPGYRMLGDAVPPPDAAFLERAWSRVAAAACKAGITVVLGTEQIAANGLRISTRVFSPDGSLQGVQDKVQLDPSEEDGTYVPGSGRRLFTAGDLRFGVAICHEGFRYPETVRWAAQRGAHVVFHPHYEKAGPGSYRPTTYGDPAGSFHEKAALCRAAENTCFYATVNYASEGSPTTSAVVRPDGTLLAYQPYGTRGLLVADLDLREATGLLASRLKPYSDEAPDVTRRARP
jgi:predicted amidohydrolase